MSVWAVTQKDINYATVNNLELYFNDELAVVGDEMQTEWDLLYVRTKDGFFIDHIYGGEPDGPFSPPKWTPTIIESGTRANFDYWNWSGDLTTFTFTISGEVTQPPPEPTISITQPDIDYIVAQGLTVQVDDAIVNAPFEWSETQKLSVNIDNGVFVRVEIPSDPFGTNSVKPTIAPDSLSVIFDFNQFEGSLTDYEFIIKLDSEQPNSKGVTDTYLVPDTQVRSIVKDRFILPTSDGTPDRDLSKYLLGLIAVPFPVSEDFILAPNTPIKLGKYDTAYTGDRLQGDILSVDVGSITTPKLYNNALDYQGKTAILHLPYTDSIVIDIDYVVGHTISVRYDINLYDGFTVMNIMSSKVNNEVVQTLYVDLDIKVPFANVNYSQPPTGDPYNISIGGDNGIRQAFIEVLSFDAVLADGFFTVPVTDEALINTVKGFMTIDNIDLVSKATRTEKAMIIKQLEDGVIIKTDDVPVDPTDPTDPDPEEPTDPVDPPIETPPNVAAKVTINGVVEVGKTLTSTITDPNGVSNEVNYQWFDGTSIVGFASTYTVKTADVGKSLKLTVTFTDNDGYDEVATSANTVLVPQPVVNSPSSVTITGTAEIGYTLTANVTDSNGVPSNVIYEWYAGTQLVAVSATYTIKETDANKQLYVKVSFTDNDGYVETATSAKTALVPVPVVNSPSSVTITGTNEVNEILTANITDSNGVPSNVIYKWSVDSVVVGTAKTYTVKETDATKVITLEVNFTDNDGFVETATAQITINEYVKPEVNLWVGADDLTTFELYRFTTIKVNGNIIRATSTNATDTVGIQQKSVHAKSVLTRGVAYKLSFDVRGNVQPMSIIYMEGSKAKVLITDASIPVTDTTTNVTVNFTAATSTTIGTFRLYSTKSPVGTYFEVSNMKLEEV